MELRDGETIIANIRQHWIVMAAAVSGAIAGFAVIIIAALYLPFDFFGYASAVYALVVLILLAWLLFRLYIWRANALMVTNFRLINNEQRGLFNRTVTELLYHDITDISFTQDGVMASSYDYGTVVIRLPSQNQVMVQNIPHPSKVIELVNRIRMGAADPAPMPAPAQKQNRSPRRPLF